MIHTFRDCRTAKHWKPTDEFSHWTQRSNSTTDSSFPVLGSFPPWTSYSNPLILSYPPSDGSHLSFSGPEQGSDFLSWRDLLPDLCHLVFTGYLHSALTFCSLNTLVGSPVASLQLLQLGLGYKLLPTELEGTKISEHSKTSKQNTEKKVISFSCGVKVSRAQFNGVGLYSLFEVFFLFVVLRRMFLKTYTWLER